MPLALVRAKSHGVLPFPLPDEALSSWVGRQDGMVRLIPDRPTAQSIINLTELDYGELEIDDADIDPMLAARLKLLARWPAPYLRSPIERDIACWQCWREQWAKGLPLYRSRQWTFAWRSSCSRHRCPLTTNVRMPRRLEHWPIEQVRPPGKMQDHVMRLFPGTSKVPLWINLFHDRRAIYLEAALEDISTSEWYPEGFDQASLHRSYAIISWLLQLQFGMRSMRDASREQFRVTSPAYFAGIPTKKRTVIEYWSEPQRLVTHDANVIAEAILSVWTKTPLPHISAERTANLVRLVGWEIGGERPPLKLRLQQDTKSLDDWFHLQNAGHYGLEMAANSFPSLLRARLHRAIRERDGSRSRMSAHELAMVSPSPFSSRCD